MATRGDFLIRIRAPSRSLLVRDEPHRGRPSRKEIGAGNEFVRESRKECPMPSEKTNHHESHDDVEKRVGGRDGTFCE